MLDAKDGFGKPVRRAGSQGYPTTGEGRRPQGIHNTQSISPGGALPRVSDSVTAAIYTLCTGLLTRRQQSRRKEVDDLTGRLSASRTGCGQRTLERPPSFQAVPRCAQSTTPGPLPL